MYKPARSYFWSTTKIFSTLGNIGKNKKKYLRFDVDLNENRTYSINEGVLFVKQLKTFILLSKIVSLKKK